MQLLKHEENEAFICLSMAFLQTGVLKNFAIFTGKHLCWILFFKVFLFLYFFSKYMIIKYVAIKTI